jgi:5-keto 4-deoxyuronate isomerase
MVSEHEAGYNAEALRNALAVDPRVLEPELVVQIVADRVVVTGVVPTDARRDAVGEVLGELVKDLQVDNRTEVASFQPPAGSERIT